jgi:tight adherence protein C
MSASVTQFLSILAAVCASGAIGCVVLYMVTPRQGTTVRDRLKQYVPEARSLRELEMRASFYERAVSPILRGLAQIVQSRTPEASIAKIRQRLLVAGKSNMTVADFLGMKGLVAILFVLAMAAIVALLHVSLLRAVVFLGFALVAGFFGPDLWLRQEANKRRTALTNALPDALDLLTIMVEAGLGFDGALQRLVDKAVNPLTLEFNTMLQEIRLGKSNREALRSLAERCDVEDISSFVSSLIQAQQLGVALARVLRIQAFQMRLKRRQRAEVKAHQAPIKMLFPMVFLTFPAMFIIILGPAVPQIMDALGNVK